MANTYTQIHFHIVYAVKYRAALIDPSWQEDLNRYITGIVQNNKHKMLAINGMPDHLHMFIGYRPTQLLGDLLEAVKGSSSKWINETGRSKSQFRWQTGYGAFSYAKSDIKKVCRYVENQQEHHREKTFLGEYRELLKEFDVDFDERYIFKELE